MKLEALLEIVESTGCGHIVLTQDLAARLKRGMEGLEEIRGTIRSLRDASGAKDLSWVWQQLDGMEEGADLALREIDDPPKKATEMP